MPKVPVIPGETEQDAVARERIQPLNASGPKPFDNVSDWLLGFGEARRVRTSERQASLLSPERSRRILKAQQASGLPGDLIDDNLDEIEARIRESEFDALKFYRQSPTVAKWYADNPHRIAVRREDLDSMGTIEAWLRALSVGYTSGLETNELGRLGTAQLFGDRTRGTENRIAALERSLARRPTGDTYAATWLFPAAEFLGQMLDSLWQSKEMIATGAGIGATLGSVLPGAGTVAGAGKGAALGLTTGFAVDSFQVEAGHAYIELSRMRGLGGETISEETRVATSLFVGTINAALETVGFKIFGRALKSAGRKLVTRPVMNAVTRHSFRRAMKEFGKNWAMVVGGEVATEVAQEGMNIIGERAAQMATQGRFDNPNAWDRLAGITGKVFRGMSLLALPGASVSLIGDTRRVLHNQQVLMGIRERMQNTEIAKLVPDDVEQVFKEMTDDAGLDVLYISADAIVDFYRRKAAAKGNPDVRQEMAAALGEGDAKRVNAALRTGSEVALPTSKVLSKLLPGEDGEFYAQNGRFRNDSLTPGEAQQYLQQNMVEADPNVVDFRALAKEPMNGPPIIAGEPTVKQEERAPEETPPPAEAGIVEEVTAEEASAQEVARVVGDALEKAGFERVVLDDFLTLIEERARVRAERRGLGETPFQLFRRHGLEIVEEEVEALSRLRPDLLTQPSVPQEPKGIAGRFAAGQLTEADRTVVAPVVKLLQSGKSVAEATLQKQLKASAKDAGVTLSPEELAELVTFAQRAGAQVRPDDIKWKRRGQDLVGVLRGHRIEIRPTDTGTFNVVVFPEGFETDERAGELHQEGKDFVAAETFDTQREAKAAAPDMVSAEEGVEGEPFAGRRFQPFSGETAGVRETIKFADEGDLITVRVKETAFAGGQADIIDDFQFILERESPSEKAMTQKEKRAVFDREFQKAGYDSKDRSFRFEVSAQSPLAAPPEEGDITGTQGTLFQGPAIGSTAQQVLAAATGDVSKALAEIANTIEQTTDPDVRAQMLEAKEQLELLTQPGRASARGGISFRNRNNVILILTKSRDMSTLLHEFGGHLWLEELIEDATTEGTPDQLRADLDAVLEWMGVDVRSADGAAAIRAAVTHAHHEKWATAAENYFRKGEAPKSALRRVFDNFFVWLTQIYKNWLDIGGPQLTPEIQSVMDRLIATDEEIRGAESRLMDQSQVDRMKNLGFSDQKVEALQRAQIKARISRRETLRKRLLEQAERKRSKEAQEVRKRLVEEETENVMQDPRVEALLLLSTGKFPDGTDVLASGAKPDKLAADALVEEYGDFILKVLPRSVWKVGRKGLTPDQAAEDMGMDERGNRAFNSGDDLIKALQELMEEGRQASPVLDEIVAKERRSDELEAQQAVLEAARDDQKGIAAEEKAFIVDAKKRLTERLGELDRQILEDLKVRFEEIRKLGGIRPTDDAKVSFERLPRRFRPKRKRDAQGNELGYPSDELAQTWFEEGVIARPDSEALYDWLELAVSTEKNAKERLKSIPKQVNRMVRGKISRSIDVLTATVEERIRLNDELKKLRKDAAVIERDIRLTGNTIIRNIINDRVEARLTEEFPTLEQEGQVPSEALDAIHDDNRAAELREEAKLIASEDFRVLHDLQRRVAHGHVQEDAIVKAMAEDLILSQSPREINPESHVRSQAALRREATDMLKKGDFEGYLRNLERIRVQHEMYRLARQMQRTHKRIERDFRRMGRRKFLAKVGKFSPEHRDHIQELLSSYGYRRRAPDDVRPASSIAEFVAKLQADHGLAPPISQDVANEAARKNWRDTPMRELIEVDIAVKALVHQAKKIKEMLVGERKGTLEENLGRGAAAIDKATKGKRLNIDPEGEKKGVFGRLFGNVKDFSALMRKAGNLYDMMEGFLDRRGVFWELMQRPFNRKVEENVEVRDILAGAIPIRGKKAGKPASKISSDLGKAVAETMRKRDVKSLDELLKLYSLREWNKMKKRIRREDLGVDISKQGIIAIALNWGNIDSRIKMIDGFAIMLGRDPNAENVREKTAVELVTLLNELDERDIEFVNGIHALMDVLWEHTRALSERVDGIPVERVESLPYSLPNGRLEGGYYPLSYSEVIAGKNQLAEAKTSDAIRAEEEIRTAMEGSRFRGLTRHGHRINRVKGVQRPIRLDLGLVGQHLGEVVHDLTHYEMLVDANRLLAGWRDKIVAHFGKRVFDQLKFQLQALAEGDSRPMDGLDRIMSRLRAGTTIAVLGLKVSTALMQFPGITSSIEVVGLKWIAQATRHFTGKAVRMENAFQTAIEKSLMMRQRPRTMTAEINDINADLSAVGRTLRWIEGWALVLAVKAQQVVDTITWHGAYEKAYDQIGMKPPKSLDGATAELLRIEDEAVARADQVVIDTQGSGLRKDLAQIQQKNEAFRFFTLFTTFHNARWNLAARAIGRAQQKGLGTPQGVALLGVSMLTLYALPAAFIAIMYDLVRQEEEEEDLTKRIGKGILFEPLADPIFVRELGSAIQGYRYRGPAGLKLFGEAGDLAQQVYQGEVDASFFRELNDFFGVLIPYPSEQLEATVEGFDAWLAGEAGPGAIMVGPAPKPR